VTVAEDSDIVPQFSIPANPATSNFAQTTLHITCVFSINPPIHTVLKRATRLVSAELISIVILFQLPLNDHVNELPLPIIISLPSDEQSISSINT